MLKSSGMLRYVNW